MDTYHCWTNSKFNSNSSSFQTLHSFNKKFLRKCFRIIRKTEYLSTSHQKANFFRNTGSVDGLRSLPRRGVKSRLLQFNTSFGYVSGLLIIIRALRGRTDGCSTNSETAPFSRFTTQSPLKCSEQPSQSCRANIVQFSVLVYFLYFNFVIVCLMCFLELLSGDLALMDIFVMWFQY